MVKRSVHTILLTTLVTRILVGIVVFLIGSEGYFYNVFAKPDGLYATFVIFTPILIFALFGDNFLKAKVYYAILLFLFTLCLYILYLELSLLFLAIN